MGEVRRVKRIGENINAHKILIGIHEEKKIFG
jgi:hypothetical protein